MRKSLMAFLPLILLAACSPKNSDPKTTDSTANQSGYEFVNGYPTEATIQKAYDDADLNRAIQTYKFFYATVSGAAIIKGNQSIGISSTAFGTLDTKPGQVGYTLNSDTPYGPIPIDLSNGPMVIELPPAPLIVVAMDVNQRWVADMGIPGPDGGKGGKHLILPPNYAGKTPASGYHVWKSTTNNLIVGARSLPVGGDVPAALQRLTTIKVYPYSVTTRWTTPTWMDLTDKPQNTTPLQWETNIKYWEVLAEVINNEPAFEPYKAYYGELAALGIEKGKPFQPDARMKKILEQAAVTANAQMRVQAFADRRADRIVWKDRQWEWIGLQPTSGDFYAENYLDITAREVWFYQAIGASPAMFRRQAGFGSLYWLGLRDNKGVYVDGSKNYKLTIPQPVPGKLFWSVTVYDSETRSQIATDQNKAALRSMFELKDFAKDASVDLYFGPTAPAGKEKQWIKTIPGKGWFAYIRVYGPEEAAFNGNWKPGDYEEMK